MYILVKNNVNNRNSNYACPEFTMYKLKIKDENKRPVFIPRDENSDVFGTDVFVTVLLTEFMKWNNKYIDKFNLAINMGDMYTIIIDTDKEKLVKEFMELYYVAYKCNNKSLYESMEKEIFDPLFNE